MLPKLNTSPEMCHRVSATGYSAVCYGAIYYETYDGGPGRAARAGQRLGGTHRQPRLMQLKHAHASIKPTIK